ncbi:hypothetical protein QO002_000882 [Pararhizobium capsulatum DSM 1112]|uniref:Yip1 domain-containing protein n=1 Tax=Pararhizobium capsulatum DSM 1112 TaxID=1121113 RepID=A0ABU0BLW4_9HYPH|nr:hypothetical protein [Pararhizobium capsulatum]MDQ0318744.1 hypothetical protein [Pararhizobium capsulatum DSM 1112]
MPQLEEIGTYLKGIWLLLSGDKRGFDYLDLSAIGVWRSFASILWCLPAMAVSWGAWRLYYLANMPQGTPAGLTFILKLFLIDLSAWVLPLALIAVLARPLAYSEILADVIVTSNWISLPIFYAMAVPAAIRLVIPGSEGLTALLSLVTLVVSFAAVFRLIKTIASPHALLAFALTTLSILPSLIIGELMQRALGLFPG